jgi:hypothetical protein
MNNTNTLYVARHIATRYWKDTTTKHVNLSNALIIAAFKHVDVLKGLNPKRMYKFKLSLHQANGDKVGERVANPYCFVYHNSVMSVECGHQLYVVTRC